MTVRDAFKDEMAMLAQLAGYSNPTEHLLEEILTDVNPVDGKMHGIIHNILHRVVRETLMRIYGTLLWISTDLKVLKDPKPYYSLGVMAIEKDTGICITWDKRTKSPYLYRDLYSVDDFVRLLEEVDSRMLEVFGDEICRDNSDAVTNANQTIHELARTYEIVIACVADAWDVLEYLCDNPKLCPILKEIARRTRETFPDVPITYRVCQDPEKGNKYLSVQVQPSQPDDIFNEKLDQILNAVSSQFKDVSGWIQLTVLPWSCNP
jgi:hypothetical protein